MDRIGATAASADRAARGRAARKRASRSAHAVWIPAVDRPDPVAVLERQGRDRLQELLPIRYGRMTASPFAFLRGAAAVMAADLAAQPHTGLTVQLCGDAHLLNFGLFASPERALHFDLNDFDETCPGPFEWDVKRLAASVAVAAREAGHAEARSTAAPEWPCASRVTLGSLAIPVRKFVQAQLRPGPVDPVFHERRSLLVRGTVNCLCHPCGWLDADAASQPVVPVTQARHPGFGLGDVQLTDYRSTLTGGQAAA